VNGILSESLEDAFLASAVPIATESEKQRQLNPRKIYPVDTGLISAYDRSPRANLGHLLESAVFTELQRRRMEVAWVHTPRGFEVDFLARDPQGGELLVQACADPDDPATLAREVRALEDAATVFPRARKLLLIAHSRLPKPSVPPPIEILTTWQWMRAQSRFVLEKFLQVWCLASFGMFLTKTGITPLACQSFDFIIFLLIKG